MTTPFPHHAALTALLTQGQFDACKIMAEALIAQQIALPQPDDQELARLHLILCRTLVGLEDYKSATAKADIAAFLARKLKDDALLEEALYRAGGCCIRSGDYRPAIHRLTESLDCGSAVFREETQYNRGLAYDSQGAYSYAVADYEAALRSAAGRKPHVARVCSINLAWVLIRLREFTRAEEILTMLSEEAGGHQQDEVLQLQVAHDRLHMAYLKGRHGEALTQALAALRRSGKNYPHIRAQILLTLVSLAVDGGLPQQAFTFGLLAKRLAAQARRPDIDEKVSRQLQAIEYQVGSEHLVESLHKLRQVPVGHSHARRIARGATTAGGVG